MIVNKPYGLTSFDVVARIRKILGVKKVGHSGTLDPIATGVLPVFFGKATKAISFLQNGDKEYLAKFKLGVKTDTQDVTGNVLKKEPSFVLEDDLKRVLKLFVGEIEQIPPMFSAVKVFGVPLYKLARQGKVVERKKRSVKIYELECLQFDEEKQEGVLQIFCSSGTYVRTLIEDFSLKLGTVGGILLQLVRTKACGFCLDNVLTLEEIEQLFEEDRLKFFIFPVEKVFENYSTIELNLKQQNQFLNGVKLKIENKTKKKGLFAVFGDRFLGVAHFENDLLKIDRVF